MKKIWIVGISELNRGSQAMAYTIINEIKRRNLPYEEVVRLCSGYNRGGGDSKYQNYLFRVERDSFAYRAWAMGGAFRLFALLFAWKKKTPLSQIRSFERDLKAGDIILDASGFCLSSKQGIGASVNFLLNIGAAKRKKVNIYLLPQSFGPFDYTGLMGRWLTRWIRKSLSYPSYIFAREQQGLMDIKRICPEARVCMATDIVLEGRTVDRKYLFKDVGNIKEYTIKTESVVIIPNRNMLRFIDREFLLSVYDKLILELKKENFNVFLIYHDVDDKMLCQEIYKRNKKDLTYIEEELNCFELENLLGQMIFGIAARYHSIVQMYKKGKPCMILGWAEKYRELAETFGQQKYLIDISELKEEACLDKLRRLQGSYREEQVRIGEKVKTIEKNSCFDKIDELNII